MANGNIDSAFGLRSLKSAGDADRNGQLQTVHIPATDATAMFMGSPVSLSGDADAVEKVPEVTLAAPGARAYGVVQGFRPNYGSGLNNDNKSRAANTDRYAMVKVVMPSDEFEIQADAPVTTAMVGQLFDLTAEVGNATTGRSTVELNVASGGTASGQVQLIRVLNTPDNEFGASADCVVVFNESLASSEADGV